MNITEEIKNSLKNKGLKQSYIAEQLNISNQSFWYKLQNNTFKIDELFKLAKILGINLNKFKEVWEVPKIIDYEKIGTLKRKLEKIMEDFVGFENQLYPLQETYKNLNKSLEKTLEGMTSTNNILKYIINH